MRLRRLAAIEDRRITTYERRYAAMLSKAIKAQGEHYIKYGYISNNVEGVLVDLYRSVLPDFLQRQWSVLTKGELTKSEDFFINTWDAWVKSYISTNLNVRAASIDDTTKKWIRDAVDAGAQDIISDVVGGISAGSQQGVIAERIRRVTSGRFGKYRAKMIARTEMGEAVNIAKTKSSNDWSEQTGQRQGKLWIHRGAHSPRDWHVALDDGIAIPKEDYWTVTAPTGESDRMMHPHDTRASAANVVNCGCTVIYTRWKDGDNRY